MVLGESAALAADLAIKLGCDMQDIPYKNLRECLLEAGQVLDIEVRPDEAQVAVPA